VRGETEKRKVRREARERERMVTPARAVAG